MDPVMMITLMIAIAVIVLLWHIYGEIEHAEQHALNAENRAREAEHLATGAILALKAHIEGEDFDIHVMKLRETEIE